MPNHTKTIYFLTGASGVGKTTLLADFQKKYAHQDWAFLNLDSTGVPSPEQMKKQYGSAAGWQKAKTNEWIEKLITQYHNEKIFLEGQVNLQFIQNAFQKHRFTHYQTILIDCSEEEMIHRLTHKRAQPELLTADMRNWLQFLRNQAHELKIPIIDTSKLSQVQSLKMLEKIAVSRD